MNVAAIALLGLATGLGQPSAPPPADYMPMNQRTLSLPVNYKADRQKDILKLQLLVSQEQSGVWQVVHEIMPEQKQFTFTAKEDGVYWMSMLTVFKNGEKDPADPNRVPPDRVQKVLIDATPPVLRITNARRDGDDVFVEWAIEDKYPNDAATVVQYRPSGSGESAWEMVPAGSLSKRSARFKSSKPGPITVQVAVKDLVGNPATMARELPGNQTSTSLSPSAVRPAGVDASTIPPPTITAESPSPALVAPTLAPAPIPAPTPTIAPPAEPTPPPPAPIASPVTPPPGTWQPAATTDAPRPIAVGAGSAQSFADAQPGMQVINFLRFEMPYQVESGPSGVSRVDLYVTRDDGRSWVKWSQHDGRESPLRVALDTRFNAQPEGDYGFRLVPISGAGLSDPAPTTGSQPEVRVHVDVTPPIIKVFMPTADTEQRNVLVLHWSATDRNFGKDPVAIEWSEQPVGPWRPVTGSEGVTPVVAGQTVAPGRVPNTGSYPWQLPSGLATHRVYLKFTAWDAAGNRSEVITPSPVQVDLTKPRAKIQGIVGSPIARP